jgi:hypothetical protein
VELMIVACVLALSIYYPFRLCSHCRFARIDRSIAVPSAIDPRYHKMRSPFGRWLLDQAGRSDRVGELARGAARDPQFPHDGDFRAVSARLNAIGADGDVHAVLEEAELDWAAF